MGRFTSRYALRTASAPYRTVDAVGNGVVDQYDANGNFVARIATGGQLDSQWGVAIAPASFGVFGGDILIGNFGNGMISAYDPTSFTYRGLLTDGTGKPLAYPSLWELLPASTAVTNSTLASAAARPATVYFTAGLAGEQHGLFGAIANFDRQWHADLRRQYGRRCDDGEGRVRCDLRVSTSRRRSTLRER